MDTGANYDEHVQYLMAVPDNVKPAGEPFLGHFRRIYDRANNVYEPHGQLGCGGEISYGLRMQKRRLMEAGHDA